MCCASTCRAEAGCGCASRSPWRARLWPPTRTPRASSSCIKTAAAFSAGCVTASCSSRAGASSGSVPVRWKVCGIGIALQAQHRLGSRRCCRRVIAQSVDSRPGCCAYTRGRAGRNARMQNDGDVIVIDGQRRNSRAVTPYRVVDRPAGWISLRSEIAVVRYDIAGDFLHSRRDHLIGQIGQRFFRRAVALGVVHKREYAAGEICVAPSRPAPSRQPGPRGIRRLSALDRRADAKVGTQRRQRHCGRKQLRVRRRHKIPVRVLRVDRLARIGIGDDHPPISLFAARRFERRLNALSKSGDVARFSFRFAC